MQDNLKRLFVFVIMAVCELSCFCKPYRIQFSIPEIKIIDKIPMKDRDFAYIIPGRLETYIYDQEEPYYQGYQRSYYAVTCKKAGWDCMRHYEILANGCIPYFIDLEKCDPDTMFFLPKELILEAMHLEGVSYLSIDHSKFDKNRYYEILQKLLEHTKKYLSTRNMAQYVLKTVNYSGNGKILFLSGSLYPDYMRDCLLIGLKENFGARIVDYPKIDFLYTSYLGDIRNLYGKGFSYSRVLQDLAIDREKIKERILNKEFELIIYGSVHRGLPLLDSVSSVYGSDQIVYVCGEDCHVCDVLGLPNLFLREFEQNNG